MLFLHSRTLLKSGSSVQKAAALFRVGLPISIQKITLVEEMRPDDGTASSRLSGFRNFCCHSFSSKVFRNFGKHGIFSGKMSRILDKEPLTS